MHDIHKKLREGGWLAEGEFIIGIRAYLAENAHDRPTRPLCVQVLIINAPTYEAAQAFLRSPEPIVGAREIKVEFSVEDLFAVSNELISRSDGGTCR